MDLFTFTSQNLISLINPAMSTLMIDSSNLDEGGQFFTSWEIDLYHL